MSKEMVHDKIGFTTDRDLAAIEVWSDEPDPTTAFYSKPQICLTVEARDESAFGRIQPSEARLLAAMLIRAAERVETMQKVAA